MTGTLVYERLNTTNEVLLFEQVPTICRKSYYRFYQLKLRQLLIENRSHEEQNGKSFPEKRFPKAYMNPCGEKKIIQAQHDEHSKRIISARSGSTRQTKDTITSTMITNTNIPTESRSKSILKNKSSASSIKHQRVISAPVNSQRNVRKRTLKKIPTIRDDNIDDNLPKSNASYTQTSSSTQHHMDENNEYARQLVLNTVVVHLHSSTPSDLSKWNLYRHFDEKFAASISPSVYRSFERIIL